MDIVVREVAKKDYPDILSLWNNEIGNRDVTAENIASHYDRIENDERYKTFVAVINGEVVGFVSSVQSLAVGLDAGFIHIVGIAVKHEKQNKGIGTKLLQHMEHYAKEKGTHSIILNSGVKRTKAHIFYQNNGYDKDSWCFDKRV